LVTSDWPGENKIKALIRDAGALFVWFSTACWYIDDYDQRLNQHIPPESEVDPSQRYQK